MHPLVGALAIMAVVVLAGTLALGALIAIVLTVVRMRSAAWKRAGESLGLVPVRGRRPAEELGHGVSSLMANAILLGGWSRLVGQWDGEEVELVLRGETGSGGSGRPFMASSRTPVRRDYTHVRVRAALDRPSGLIVCAHGELAREMAVDLGPPSTRTGDADLDRCLAAWSFGSTPASSMAHPLVRAAVAEIEASQGLPFANDVWAGVELRGAHTAAPVLERTLRQAIALARALRAASGMER